MILPLRNNPVAWLSPIVAVAVVFMWITAIAPLQPDPYWTAYLTSVGDGLQYGLPFAAAATAWASWRVRRIGTATAAPCRSMLAVYWAHTWPLYLGVLIGLGASLMGEVTAQPPQGAIPNLLIIATFGAMTVFASGIGWICGWLLPVALGLPVSFFAAFEWAVFPLTMGDHVSQRNLMGYALFGCCASASREPTLRAIIAPVIMGLAMIAVIAMTGRGGRAVWSITAIAGLVGVGIAGTTFVSGTDAYGSQLRSSVHLRCDGALPRVCVFPEIGTNDHRAFVRSTITDAFAHADAQGLALPSTVAQLSARPKDRGRVTQVALAGDMDRTAVIRAYAAGLIDSLDCEPIEARGSVLPATAQLQMALEVVLGQRLGTATPEIELGGEGGQATGPPPTAEDVRSLLGIHSIADARAISAKWLDGQRVCMEDSK